LSCFLAKIVRSLKLYPSSLCSSFNIQRVLACEANLVDLGCYIHTLQLIVVEGLNAQQVVINTIATAHSIVGHFRHSVKATEQLKKTQELLNSGSNPHLPVHKLIQDVSTRWDSTFYMLERLIEQKRAIAVYSQEL